MIHHIWELPPFSAFPYVQAFFSVSVKPYGHKTESLLDAMKEKMARKYMIVTVDRTGA